MALLNRTPQARKEALAYCRRCLVVMVCCVLVFGLTVPAAPRAKAVAGVDDVALLGISGLAGAGVGMANGFASHPVEGSLGQFVITGSGVKIKTGYVFDDLSGTTYFDAKAQELGYELVTYLVAQGGTAAQWIGDTVASYQAKGGLAPGDSFEMPAAVVSAARQWALQRLGFVDGVLGYDTQVLQGVNGTLVLTHRPLDMPLDANWHDISVSPGTVVKEGSTFSFEFLGSDSAFEYNIYPITDPFPELKIVVKKDGVDLFSSLYGEPGDLFFWLYERYDHAFLVTGVRRADGKVVMPMNSSWKLGDLLSRYPVVDLNSMSAVATTLTKTSALDDTPDETIVVTIPQLPAVDVGGYTVPVAEELTPADVTKDPAMPTTAPGTGITAQDIAGAIGQTVPGAVASGIAQALPGAIADALPITGAIAGDQVVGEIAEDPAGLGAVFISKFPFCIPWDIVKAIQLLAAPPVTPRWELDFMQPIAGRVGGFQGSTNLVLDFSEYPIVGIATRWVSTVLFVYALASGTKRMLWTA